MYNKEKRNEHILEQTYLPYTIAPTCLLLFQFAPPKLKTKGRSDINDTNMVFVNNH